MNNQDAQDPHPMPTDLDPDPIRPHAFDGDIREYDKRLPNWWLATFYGAIVFAICYWVYYQVLPSKDPGVALAAEMEKNAQTASAKAGVVSDDLLWKMSQQSAKIEAGKLTYTTTCAACHMPDLTGAIGPNLKDTEWIHGGKPMDLMQTVTAGVLVKGMPTWGPVLGQEKITEVVAYILSFHKQGEPVQIVSGWIPHAPGMPAVPPPPLPGPADAVPAPSPTPAAAAPAPASTTVAAGALAPTAAPSP